MSKAPRVVNWKETAFVPYPAIDGADTGLSWCPVRSGDESGAGFYVMKVAPGGGAKLHHHHAQEEFLILEGELQDIGGHTYRTGDCVSFPPGSSHATVSPGGCTLVAFIAGALSIEKA